MRIVLKLAVAGTVVALAGCSTLSSLNPFSSKKAPSNPPAALVEFKPTLAATAAWTVGVGSAGAHVFSPAAARNSLFAAAADGTLTRIEAASGRALWRINAGMPLTAGVGSDGNLVVVAGEKGRILAFDENGKEVWKAQASSEVLSAPAVGLGLVVVRSVDNSIAGFDAATGKRRWVLQRSLPTLTLRSAPGIVIADGNAYAALPGGRLLAVTLNNGGPRWEVAVGEARGATELERMADTSGAPLLLGRDVCAVAYQGRAACFDGIGGTARWARNLSSEVGLGGDERFVFAADEAGSLHALTRESGASVWRNKQLANRRLSAPLSFGRAVVVADYQGYVHFLSREDGTMLARVATDGSPVMGTPVVAGSHAVFQTRDGTLVAFGVN
ncbi:outer membrane protein assembly factor BamB [Noviherbaspirillum sedimenti]|uniref:Outer membrane protein assembly factor BamB n=1 Tax=Noviherbaspirillum sedimenti TaxID=2320865 RepID=A0A3A3FYQ6_9BURK|nr:outer membrane protein assembly factor BamB [Noviherbaspirillum sedimenti]RJG00485.1 outer membrane protein assembly factor BamB [Noviherbaspirillum sedimenti]